MKNIFIGLSLLWLLPFSFATLEYIVENEEEKRKMGKEIKKCLKSSKRS